LQQIKGRQLVSLTFITSKALSELVSLTWRMENAPKVVERQKKERFDVIREMFFEGVCVENCNGEWHRCALQILKKQ